MFYLIKFPHDPAGPVLGKTHESMYPHKNLHMKKSHDAELFKIVEKGRQLIK